MHTTVIDINNVLSFAPYVAVQVNRKGHLLRLRLLAFLRHVFIGIKEDGHLLRPQGHTLGQRYFYDILFRQKSTDGIAKTRFFGGLWEIEIKPLRRTADNRVADLQTVLRFAYRYLRRDLYRWHRQHIAHQRHIHRAAFVSLIRRHKPLFVSRKTEGLRMSVCKRIGVFVRQITGADDNTLCLLLGSAETPRGFAL